MAYVPMEIWVPDTAEGGPIVQVVQLKTCEECKAPIPRELMDEHMENVHPDLEIVPH